MELLRLQGVRTAYGCVTLPMKKRGPPPGSGFRQLGVYRNTGYKCGAWHDVAWFEKALGPYGGAPEPGPALSRCAGGGGTGGAGGLLRAAPRAGLSLFP